MKCSFFISEAPKDECGEPRQFADVQAGEAVPPKEAYAETLDGPSKASKGPN